MKKKRTYLLIGTLILMTSGLAIYQNCAGYQERSLNISVQSDYVNQNLADVSCAAQGGNTDQAATTAINDVSAIAGEDGGQLFYSEAPLMGPVSVVAPMNYQTLLSGYGAPVSIYGFFAVGSDGTGSLVIGIADGSVSNGTPGATATPTGQIISQKRINVLKFPPKHILDGTSTQSCSNSNPLSLSTALTAYNDGTMGLEPASFDGDIFEMELALDGGTTLRVRSYDVQDGELQSVIQLEIDEVDPNSGQEIYIGDINMTQPD